MEQQVRSALESAGWDCESRVQVSGVLRADFLLRFRGCPLAVVEWKRIPSKGAGASRQVVELAHRLGLRFAVETDGQKWTLLDLALPGVRGRSGNRPGTGTVSCSPFDSPPSPAVMLKRLGAGDVSGDSCVSDDSSDEPGVTSTERVTAA